MREAVLNSTSLNTTVTIETPSCHARYGDLPLHFATGSGVGRCLEVRFFDESTQRLCCWHLHVPRKVKG